MSYVTNISPINTNLNYAISEAEGTFRIVRNLTPRDANNFEIKKSDNLIKMLMENVKYVTIAATFIGFITLLGAAISLMNIMLVSVKERTKEIGVRKALGAKNSIIRQQFLIESILIGEIGGILGVILGIGIGNIVAIIIKGPFVIPWVWIVGGVILCLIVGLLSGVMPAIKASKLDPIDALRYE
jgi:putative ABC transport system permease protein